MLPNKSIKVKRPYSAIRLIYLAAGNGRFGLIFWISDYRRTADVFAMFYAGLLLLFYRLDEQHHGPAHLVGYTGQGQHLG